MGSKNTSTATARTAVLLIFGHFSASNAEWLLIARRNVVRNTNEFINMSAKVSWGKILIPNVISVVKFLSGYKINLWFEIGIAHLSIRCLLVGFPALLKKIQTFERSEYKNKPSKIFQRVLQVCSEEYKDYFAPNVAEDTFQEYARVIGLMPNLFRDQAFPSKNMPYALVSSDLTIAWILLNYKPNLDCANAHRVSSWSNHVLPRPHHKGNESPWQELWLGFIGWCHHPSSYGSACLKRSRHCRFPPKYFHYWVTEVNAA